MKKNIVMRIAAVVLMCTLVTACFASSTFAKYTSEANLKDSVTVAKWSFTVDGQEIATAEKKTLDVNIFDTILDTDDSEETDVAKTASGTAMIAPGTKGAFDLKLENTSEVTAEYTLKVKPICNNDDLKAAIQVYVNGTLVTWNGDNYVDVTPADNELAIGETLEKLPITWEWDFVASGNTYTNIGIAAQDATIEYALDFEFVASQVD